MMLRDADGEFWVYLQAAEPIAGADKDDDHEGGHDAGGDHPAEANN